jgi:hypothetical protein
LRLTFRCWNTGQSKQWGGQRSEKHWNARVEIQKLQKHLHTVSDKVIRAKVTIRDKVIRDKGIKILWTFLVVLIRCTLAKDLAFARFAPSVYS